MAQINDEQVVKLIQMNARDFWTIAEENAPRYTDFLKERGLMLSPDEFVSICITQFIELKRGKNFGSVKVGDNKKEEKPEKPEPKQEKFHIKDPESPMTPGQKEGIEKLMKIPGAPKLINTYRETHDIKDGWETANKGQANDIMGLLVQLVEQKKKEKSGGDKQ